MRPQPGDSPLAVLFQDSMTVRQIEDLMIEHSQHGYPVVVGEEKMHVVGFVTQRELQTALGMRLLPKTDFFITVETWFS